MDGGQIGLLLAIIVLIVFSGFFSASEMAYTSVNKIRLLNMEQNGNKRAGKVLRETENFDKLLSTILVGNNIVNITASSLATSSSKTKSTRRSSSAPAPPNTITKSNKSASVSAK